MKYRIIDGEITDPKDVWGIGEIRHPKRITVLPEEPKLGIVQLTDGEKKDLK